MNNYKISVIIPSFDGFREGNLELLKKDIEKQTCTPCEIITVVGVSPNGKARNYGVMKASGDYYVFIDDDVRLGEQSMIEKLVTPFVTEKSIGMTGPSQLIPQNSNLFQKMAARQIPRSFFPIQDRLTESDMVSHMCLAIPAELFKKLGWENPEIISGTDPDLRYRIRKAGYRICVAPNCWAYHPMPKNLSKLLKLAFNKGKNSALTQLKFPDLVYELDSGKKNQFTPKRTFFYRIIRGCFLFLFTLLTFKFIYALYRFSYIFGLLSVQFNRKKYGVQK